jgi:hypothetical protein
LGLIVFIEKIAGGLSELKELSLPILIPTTSPHNGEFLTHAPTILPLINDSGGILSTVLLFKVEKEQKKRC